MERFGKDLVTMATGGAISANGLQYKPGSYFRLKPAPHGFTSCRGAGLGVVVLCLMLLTLSPTTSAIHLENDLENYLQELDISGEQNDMSPGWSLDDFGFRLGSEEDWLDGRPGIRRLWGVADISTPVGRLFQYSVSKDAFSGEVDHYEALCPNGNSLPSWLHFNPETAVFEGVPAEKDLGQHYVTVKAISAQNLQEFAKDVFAIDVVEGEVNPADESLLQGVSSLSSNKKGTIKCDSDADHTLVSIVMDAGMGEMKPEDRVRIIQNLSGFLGLPQSLMHLGPQLDDRNPLDDDSAILAGPGNIKKRKSNKASVVQWQVGCDGEIEEDHMPLLDQVKEQAKDGTFAEVLQFPVIGWHVSAVSPHSRERRQVGSGDGYLYEPSYDYEEENIPETRIVPTMASPVFSMPTTTHPHRHRHGEKGKEYRGRHPSTVRNTWPKNSPVMMGNIVSTPVLVPIRPTKVDSSFSIEPSRTYDEMTVTPSKTPVFELTMDLTSTSSEATSIMTTEPLPPLTMTHTVTTSAIPSPTTEEVQPTRPVPTPPTPNVVETTEYGTKNWPPQIIQRLRKVAVTAGKAFRMQIPEDTFKDFEDGRTRDLHLYFMKEDGSPIPPHYWIQFDSVKQEIYALPLDEHIQRWRFRVEANDRDGANVTDIFEIVVRQHQGYRVVHHEFSLHVKLEKSFHKYTTPTEVDWQLLLLDKIATLYGDSSPENITVKNITKDPIFFTWTNDSLPRHHCPEEEIRQLYKKLVTGGQGDITSELKRVMSPEFHVKQVKILLKGVCANKMVIGPTPSSKPAVPVSNEPPVLRNQVDKIEGIVGKLLKYKVPEDFCYDDQDGSTPDLNLTLLTRDRGSVPRSNWLRFDTKNKEFFGLPLEEIREEYQLVCRDSQNAEVSDMLVVIVLSQEKDENFNVEFSIRIATSYDEFSRNAVRKRRIVEKIAKLFGYKHNTTNIVVKSITKGSVVFAWFDKTLPQDHCPNEEIVQLRKKLIKDDGNITPEAVDTFAPEFRVTQANMMPINLCLGELTPTYVTPPPPATAETEPVKSSDDYLITFIVPAVIIAIMLLLAGIIACILYRKRRKGKMTMEENKTFVSKGIPIIFADELDDKPDPAKSPVIMKDEKPPLPPPEYHRSSGSASPTTPPGDNRDTLRAEEIEDSAASPPYQPPPPFTSNRDSSRQNRPKPTPTYRKPPPYVPP